VEVEPALTVASMETVVVPDCAKMMTSVLVVTGVVPIEKVTLVSPAGTVTVIGRFSGGLGSAGLLCVVEIKTPSPPAGAAETRVTVAVKLLPPGTLFDCREIEETFTPTGTVMAADALLPPRVAVINTPSSMSLV
jgi:hypothetical protein